MFTHIRSVKVDNLAIHVSAYGLDHSAIELGLGHFTYGQFDLPHIVWWEASRSYTLAGRIELGDTTMYALEASFWGSGLIGMGISAGYYTNFSANSFYIRPEVGLPEIPAGPVFIHAAIGWNIRLLNYKAPELNDPNFRIRLTIPLGAPTTSPE